MIRCVIVDHALLHTGKAAYQASVKPDRQDVRHAMGWGTWPDITEMPDQCRADKIEIPKDGRTIRQKL